MNTTIAQSIIQDHVDNLAEAFPGQMLDVCIVTAKMPSSVRSPYCHIRAYPVGGTEPKGNALRKMSDGRDYWEFAKVPKSGSTIKSEYGQIMAAIKSHNEQI